MHSPESLAITRFADAATRLCALLETLPRSVTDNVREIRAALANLHVAALALPRVEPDTGLSAPEPDESGLSTARLGTLPVQFYWDVFDPLAAEPEPPVGNSTADDLRDIYRDLKRGLALYESGSLNDACWSWRFSFETHWGEHMVGLQRALYWSARHDAS